MDIEDIRDAIRAQVMELRERGLSETHVELGRSQVALWRKTYPTGRIIEFSGILDGDLIQQLDVEEVEAEDRVWVVGGDRGDQPTGPLPPPP